MKTLLFILIFIPVLLFGQYTPIDTDVVAFWYMGGGVTVSDGDSVDAWNDLADSGLNPAQATNIKRPELQRWDGLAFDGVDDYLSIGAPVALIPGLGDFTIEGRIFSNTYLNGQTVYDVYTGSSSRFSLYISSSNRIGLYVNQTTGQNVCGIISPNNTLVNGSYHTFSFSCDRSDSVRCYIDGIKVIAEPADGATVNYTTGSNLYLGTYNSSTGFFSGKILCIRYSDKARSSAEVLDFHNWLVDTTKYFIATNGSDDNNGSIATPLATPDSLNTSGLELDYNDLIAFRTGQDFSAKVTFVLPIDSLTITSYDSATGALGCDAEGTAPILDTLDVNEKVGITLNSNVNVSVVMDIGTDWTLEGCITEGTGGTRNRFLRYKGSLNYLPSGTTSATTYLYIPTYITTP